jgi:hypothetical protein
VHLDHPLGVNSFETQWVKQDQADAHQLTALLRMNRLPEAWIAPSEEREPPGPTRYRGKLVALPGNCNAPMRVVVGRSGSR